MPKALIYKALSDGADVHNTSNRNSFEVHLKDNETIDVIISMIVKDNVIAILK